MARTHHQSLACLSVALTPKKTLLIGAGKIAAQKARAMDKVGFAYEVMAQEICDAFFTDKPVVLAPFEALHVKGFEVVIDATGNPEVAKELVALKQTHGFLLNVVDVPPLCDFYFSALCVRGALQVAVSSTGASPSLAQEVRDKVERLLPRTLDPLLERLKHARSVENASPQTLRTIAKSGVGKVFLIGCGPGSVDNLTVGALKAFGLLDVALIDALVSPEIEALLPLTCKRVDVSKQKGFHTKTQEEINAMLVAYAKEGLCVGRLKGGDPFVFGRLHEEKAVLAEEGIAYEVINGVSSALAACNAAGVVPTLRRVSTGMTIVSAHLRESQFNDDWVEILNKPAHTVVVLMAQSFASQIKDSLLRAGISPALPALFVSNIDREGESVIAGCVEDLDKMSALAPRPAVLILGESVGDAYRMTDEPLRPFAHSRFAILGKPPRVLGQHSS